MRRGVVSEALTDLPNIDPALFPLAVGARESGANLKGVPMLTLICSSPGIARTGSGR